MIHKTAHRSLVPIFFLTILVLMGASGCKKVAITDTVYPEFIGFWESIDGTSGYIELEIEEGYAYWVKQEGVLTSHAEGVPKIIPNRDKLKIGIIKYDIDSYPALVDGDWQMVLNGITYERY